MGDTIFWYNRREFKGFFLETMTTPGAEKVLG